MRPCPACGRRIQDAAPRCHYCNASVPHPTRAERARTAESAEHTPQPPKSGLRFAVGITVVVVLVLGLLVALLV